MLNSMTRLDSIKADIVNLCVRLKVVRLDLFGSVARGEATPQSDVDVLVQFDRSAGHLFDRYFELKESLETLFGASVDVAIEDSLRNPYLKEVIEQSRMNVYAA